MMFLGVILYICAELGLLLSDERVLIFLLCYANEFFIFVYNALINLNNGVSKTG